ncbi:MAG: Ig-like domain-containing protein, partial [Bacilli bacterium]|nr:Ig-like domain-containing protein [Bacilli bacterium]
MKNTTITQSKFIPKSRKKTLKVLFSSLIAIFAFTISACDFIKPISVMGINITDEEKTILVGETISLTYELLPNNATNKLVTWASDDESVATVDMQGEVIGEALGEATITITTIDGNFSDTCAIHVVEGSISVTGISLNQNTMTAYVGDTPRLIPVIQPLNATNKNITWSSTNTSVATIDDGLISALAAGTTNISVTTIDGGFVASCSLTVIEETLTEITINSSADFYYGSYDTNYGMKTYQGIDYGYYRADEDYNHSGMIKLSPSLSRYDYGALAGSFFNSDPISGIKKLTISYISEGGLVVRYGDTRERGYSQTIVPSNSNNWTTTTLFLGVTSCFFSIETNHDFVYLDSIKIGYNSSLTPNDDALENVDTRIAPTVYSGTLIDGISSISVPDDITISGDTYTINSYRSYTYYSYTYVNLHKNELDLSSIAMTDPVDVANYYIAFHAIPANYGN